jgi:hypothetical protein
MKPMAFFERKLTLVKEVLEVVTIYWCALAYRQKGVFHTISKRCFKFLWTWKRGKDEIPLFNEKL